MSTTAPTSTPAPNPLLEPSTLDYGLPRFQEIRDEHFLPAFRQAMAAHREQIAAILAQEQPPTWDNTVVEMERSGRALEAVAAVFFNLQGTDSSPALDAIAEEIVPELSAHDDAIYHDAALFERVRQVSVPADEESQRLHEHLLRTFRRHGAQLDDTAKAELSRINARLAVLSEEFGRNLLADTRALAVRVESADQLAGLSQARIDAARDDAARTGTEGYLLHLELPTVQAAQEKLTRKDTRAALYAASQARGEASNAAVVAESVALRARKAAILGYGTHADLVIAEETAGTAAAARKLLTDLAPAASANAAAEYKLISEVAASAEETVDPADWPYWQAQVALQDYAVDAEELSQCFPLDRVLRDGVFAAARRLYGITVTERNDLHGYAPGVQVWEVAEEDGTGIGLLLTDYFARESKRGGAWMSSFCDQSRLLGTKPVVVNVMSITPPTDPDAQPLLSLDEVTTVFHEFGHALHGLLSDVVYPRFSGTNVPRDWVEFPSQINENWALDPAVVRDYARHVETGEAIPQRLLDAVGRARQWGQGFATTEYLGAAIIDLAWHSLSPQRAEEISSRILAAVDAGRAEDARAIIESFEQSALAEAGIDVPEVAPRYRSTYFNHIFAGGYSAGYYSYLWAEVLDADGFEWFRQVGAAGPQATAEAARQAGQRFRELVLSRGASRDYDEAFSQLRGRSRDVAPLLERRGLSGTKA